MKQILTHLLSIGIFMLYTLSSCTPTTIQMNFGEDEQLSFIRTGKEWGMKINTGNQSNLHQETPLYIEIRIEEDSTCLLRGGYREVQKSPKGIICKGEIKYQSAVFTFIDCYCTDKGYITVDRMVKVNGTLPQGFNSQFGLSTSKSALSEHLKYFAPGNIYGSSENLPDNAFGKDLSLKHLLIREDRLPAPLFGIWFPDGSSVTLLTINPDGGTSRQDSQTTNPTLFTDRKVKVGSLGIITEDNQHWLGYIFPLSEGDVTYSDRTYSTGWIKREKAWSKRYHPIENGFEQKYSIALRWDKQNDFATFYKKSWRWAWEVFSPVIKKHNIEEIRKSQINVLSQNVVHKSNYYGITNAIHLAAKEQPDYQQTIMGFTGKALETAYYLLRSAEETDNPDATTHRRQALGLFNTFTRLKIAPPEAEGFELTTWKTANALGGDRVYLRSYIDDLKATLRAYQFEKSKGREHPEWLTWSKDFADWLITFQYDNGGFPRTFEPRSGKVINPAPQSSYLAIPLLVQLAEITQNEKYLQAAIKAGEYCWSIQKDGEFTGGTIDNPNAVDKEAGALSLEAYLMLYRMTRDQKWLDRAEAAAAYTETWIYIWDIPMPEDISQKELNWKKGVSTVGLQLISTGHSLADYYCCFDTDEFAALSLLTDDPHYQYVSQILLHNTCNMISLPGNEIQNLPGYGYQEEHWCLAPIRGVSNMSLWLPWVATSHLNGIYGLKDLKTEYNNHNNK